MVYTIRLYSNQLRKKMLQIGSNFQTQCVKIAANEKGLAFVGELAFRQPITEAQ
jgi:hypothetical protein